MSSRPSADGALVDERLAVGGLRQVRLPDEDAAPQRPDRRRRLLGFVARAVVAEPDVGAALRHLDGHDRADPFAARHERHAI